MTAVAPRPAEAAPASRGARLFDAVLFDRDGTLIHDVPYNGDPALVRPVDGAREALDRLRAAGLRLGVVTNQSGVARGRFGPAGLAAVNARVEELLGPFETWQVCPHAEDAGCRCRKPAPGMVIAAAAALGTTPDRCVVVGDIGRDVAAAEAAGATAVLVPTRETLLSEVASAPAVVNTLGEAADLVLHRQRFLLPPGQRQPRRRRRCVLVARADSAGDVLVTGPAVRAVAAGADRVVMLCGPRGRAAAELLPGVDELVEWRLPWIDPEPGPVDRAATEAMVDRIAAAGVEEAVVFTSFHQSALPLALLLRMAGVGRISAVSDDYPGALLDVRHRVPAGVPEAERALSLAAAAGFAPPAGDDLRLRISVPARIRRGRHVVVHPGASVPARACPPHVYARLTAALTAAGHRVLVTGGPGETDLTAAVASAGGVDLGGGTSLAELAEIVAGAGCLVAGNTGPAHIAAAVGTPVVSLYAPTVPFGQWAPFRVPVVRLGDASAPCRDTRAAVCPVPGHPCLSTVEPAAVLDAVRTLIREAA
ncbi:HAD-IIIA family hydrolase [Dactylosporangium sp. NPDC000521]|uniref:HAD-IIIA family hydrolase n=1 Tax=Dactylosporangium sp. NPDC000521 TaxID=3363975 RepID=UPI00369B3E2C